MSGIPSSATAQHTRIESIDFLRGVVMILMALDHVRMFFAQGTWYADPTNLATTTPPLFFTRWITHFCAPVFVFLAGTSAFLYGMRRVDIKETAWFLFTRGLWLVFVELVIVTFAWTFDITYRVFILQVIWAIGVSMVALSVLVFLPGRLILAIGMLLVFGHNLLDRITVRGSSFPDMIWYALHQSGSFSIDGRIINVVYPVLPWIGLMALGYVFGILYKYDFPTEHRQRWILLIGIAATLLFVLLRAFNLYGEPQEWNSQASPTFTLLSFLNTTKYPPSLHFLLMTIGPALIFLSFLERLQNRLAKPVIVFGRVPFFFYLLHLYVIHALARLSGFGLPLGAIYLVWLALLMLLFPLCRWYQGLKEDHPSQRWLPYL